MSYKNYAVKVLQVMAMGIVLAAQPGAAQTSLFPSAYNYPSNALALKFVNRTNGTVKLILKGTVPAAAYEVVGKQNLTSAWTSLTNIVGATNLTSTPLTLAGSGTSSYFYSSRYTAVSGLKLWLAADLSFGTNTASAVGTWTDLSGNSNNATQLLDNTAQPTLVTNSLNGLPVVRFDGTNDQLTVPNVAGTNNFTIIMVARTALPSAVNPESNTGVAGGAGEQYVVFDNRSIDASTNNSGAGIALGTNGISVYEYQKVNSGPDQLPPEAVFAGTVGNGAEIVSVTYTAQQPKIYLNGALVCVGLASVRTNVLAPREIGGDAYGYFQGDVAELLMFNHSLSDSDRSVVETYLNTKYQISVTVPSVPAALNAFAVSSNQVNLTWLSSANAQQFYVERKLGSGGTYAQITAVDASITSLMDTGLLANTQYYYRIRAHNTAGNSAYSNETNATTTATGVTLPLADLRLWYEADAGGQISALGQLVQWNDQSGYTNTAVQFTAADEPLFVPGQLNGRPTMRFNGSSDILLAPNVAGTNNFTVIVVAKTAVAQQIVPQSNAGDAGDSGLQFVLGDKTIDMGFVVGGAEITFGTNEIALCEYQRADTGPDQVPAEAVFTNMISSIGTGAQIISMVYTNRQPLLYLNGTLAQTGVQSTRATVLTPREIGGDSYGYFNGDIAEILMFDRILTNPERLAAEAYLNNKYKVVGSFPAALPGP